MPKRVKAASGEAVPAEPQIEEKVEYVDISTRIRDSSDFIVSCLNKTTGVTIKYRTHKLILSQGSEFFSNMFQDCHSSEDAEEEVPIVDYTPSSVLHFLRAIYGLGEESLVPLNDCFDMIKLGMQFETSSSITQGAFYLSNSFREASLQNYGTIIACRYAKSTIFRILHLVIRDHVGTRKLPQTARTQLLRCCEDNIRDWVKRCVSTNYGRKASSPQLSDLLLMKEVKSYTAEEVYIFQMIINEINTTTNTTRFSLDKFLKEFTVKPATPSNASSTSGSPTGSAAAV